MGGMWRRRDRRIGPQYDERLTPRRWRRRSIEGPFCGETERKEDGEFGLGAPGQIPVGGDARAGSTAGEPRQSPPQLSPTRRSALRPRQIEDRVPRPAVRSALLNLRTSSAIGGREGEKRGRRPSISSSLPRPCAGTRRFCGRWQMADGIRVGGDCRPPVRHSHPRSRLPCPRALARNHGAIAIPPPKVPTWPATPAAHPFRATDRSDASSPPKFTPKSEEERES